MLSLVPVLCITLNSLGNRLLGVPWLLVLRDDFHFYNPLL